MIAPEFSRPIALDRVGIKEKLFAIEANESERAALATRLGVPEVRHVAADITLKLTNAGQLVRLKGRLKARLVQICVVTLEPFETEIDEDFARLYATETDPETLEVIIDPNQDDPPDPIEEGHIDIGEAAAEHLALAMDPFARKPGADFLPPAESAPEEPEKPSPFAVLASRRKKN